MQTRIGWVLPITGAHGLQTAIGDSVTGHFTGAIVVGRGVESLENERFDACSIGCPAAPAVLLCAVRWAGAAGVVGALKMIARMARLATKAKGRPTLRAIMS